MLIGKDIVVMGGTNGAEPVVQEYDRYFFSYAENQPMKDVKKTFDGKELPNVCRRPNGDRLPVDPAVLMEDALAVIAKEYPGTKEKPVDSIIVLLEAAEYGLDLWRRNKIQADLRPSKPIDVATALARMEKSLRAAHPNWTDEKVKARAAAALSDED